MKRQRYFQWLDGELAGNVETLKAIEQEDGEYFYVFASGESCNLRYISKITNNITEVKDKFMVEIASPNDPWIAETISTKRAQVMDESAGEMYVEVPALEDITGASGSGTNINIEKSKVGTKKFRAPRYKGPFFELPSFDDYMEEETHVKTSTNVPVPETTPTEKEAKDIPQENVAETSVITSTPKISTVSETDPVRILAKTCKKHPTEINLTLNINLPSKAIYNIAESEFENGGKNFVDCLVENIDITEIVKSISDALRDAYSQNETAETE